MNLCEKIENDVRRAMKAVMEKTKLRADGKAVSESSWRFYLPMRPEA